MRSRSRTGGCASPFSYATVVAIAALTRRWLILLTGGLGGTFVAIAVFVVLLFMRTGDSGTAIPYPRPLAASSASASIATSSGNASRRDSDIVGDIAYVAGSEVGTVKMDGADRSAIEVRVTLVFRRLDDRWRIVHRHGSLAPPGQLTPPT
jgi:hypothetical protein